MPITIYQGNNHQLEPSDINIVIDVIRAFTVAHYAFLNHTKEILLVGTIEEALNLKEVYPDYLLAGEVKGLAIPGFDLDNSPNRITKHNIKEKTLVQKTTNGVTATLNALNANDIFVTGFSNAKTTAHYVRHLSSMAQKELVINIIASHPTGDDDLACAEYIKSIIQGIASPTAAETAARIRDSYAAQKFFDEATPEFDFEDISFCTRELASDFVMRVNKSTELPKIERCKV